MRKVSTIRAAMAKLEAELKAVERRESKGLKAVWAMMNRHGISLDDLVASKSGSRKAHPLAGKPAPVKYRDPKSGQTWSGRGRPAAWLTAAEKAGKKRESFLVK